MLPARSWAPAPLLQQDELISRSLSSRYYGEISLPRRGGHCTQNPRHTMAKANAYWEWGAYVSDLLLSASPQFTLSPATGMRDTGTTVYGMRPSTGSHLTPTNEDNATHVLKF